MSRKFIKYAFPIIVLAFFGVAGNAWSETSPTLSSNGSICTIIGTSGNDILKGTSGSDVICGLGGDDTVTGFGGDDTIDAGDGNDQVRGGPGNDSIDPG